MKQLDIAQLKNRCIRVLHASRRQRHVDDRRRWQHRYAVNSVIGEKRKQRHIEMIDPGRVCTYLTKAEQRVIADRVCRLGRLDRLPKPKAFALPWTKRQPARIIGAVEPSAMAHIVPGGMEPCRDRRERIAGRTAALEGRDGLSYRRGGMKRVTQIGEQHHARPDFDKKAIATGNQRRNRIRKAHRITHIAPPVKSVEHSLGDPRSGYRRDELADRGERIDTGQFGDQAIADRVHRHRMESEIKVQQPPGNPAAPGRLAKSVDRIAGTGDRYRARAIDRSDLKRIALLLV
ncbi:MAG: hypothetical protein WB697_06230, partial [Stellaceae bacterium]